MQKPGRQRLRTIIIFLLLVIGAGVVLANGQEILEVLQEADWRAIPAVLFFTVLSYGGTSYAYSRVARMVGIKVPARDLTEIGFVSLVLNHVITTGGVAGYSVRQILMDARGVPAEDTLAASMLHFYLTSLDMLAMLPFACIYILVTTSIAPGAAIALGIMAALFSLVFLIASTLVFSPRWRGVVLNLADRLACRLGRKDIQPALQDFDRAMTHGVRVMRAEPPTILVILLLILVDWVSSVATLYFCFVAFGPAPRLGQLVTGYVIGVMAGVISMVPGGLGVQEGSMAGIFALLGIPFSQAVLVTILYRILYYFLPYLLSLGFYTRLLRYKKQAPEGQ